MVCVFVFVCLCGVCMCVNVCWWTSKCVCVCVYIYTHDWFSIHTNIHTNTYIHIHTHMHIHKCTFTHIHIHANTQCTHTHIYTPTPQHTPPPHTHRYTHNWFSIQVGVRQRSIVSPTIFKIFHEDINHQPTLRWWHRSCGRQGWRISRLEESAKRFVLQINADKAKCWRSSNYRQAMVTLFTYLGATVTDDLRSNQKKKIMNTVATLSL